MEAKSQYQSIARFMTRFYGIPIQTRCSSGVPFTIFTVGRTYRSIGKTLTLHRMRFIIGSLHFRGKATKPIGTMSLISPPTDGPDKENAKRPAISSASKMPWVEAYRPRTLQDVVGNVDTVLRLRAIAKDGNLPNLIVCGPPGTGKYTKKTTDFLAPPPISI
jgi:hypothetical protein